MALLDPFHGEQKSLPEAARSLESLIVRQMLTASGAFKASTTAGASIHNDLFVESLADAITKGGGLGLASQLEHAMTPGSRTAPAPNALSPLPGATITSGFGPRADPVDGHSAVHQGVDLAAPEGSVIVAAEAGTVQRAGSRGGYGLAVELEHGGNLSTLYAHASGLLVHEGEQVQQGQPIALVGHSGHATGPHLHFEVRVGGHPVNPNQALKAYKMRDEE